MPPLENEPPRTLRGDDQDRHSVGRLADAKDAMCHPPNISGWVCAAAAMPDTARKRGTAESSRRGLRTRSELAR
jgi:hypothetical protein